MELLEHQRDIVEGNVDKTVFLSGMAGTGKTTVGVGRLAYLMDSGIPANQIQVMVPQRALALRYYDLVNNVDTKAGGQVNISTLGGLARRAVDLFWPLVAEGHGFKRPNRRPTFLSLETAQYFMARVAGPVINERGMFETIAINRNRLYSQIIDNLNKAAAVGFPHTEIGDKLKAAWTGNDEAQLRMYDDVQTCANLFREYCLTYNLLDFSLQVELFIQRLWDLKPCRDHILAQSHHIIADNLEEDTPVAHAVLADLVRQAESALLIYDDEAGYRRFLGADPDDALALRALCDEQVVFSDSLVVSEEVQAFGAALSRSLDRPTPEPEIDPRSAIRYDDFHYHPEMIDGVAEAIAGLVHDEGVPPEEIVVLAPYLSDALRFSLMNRLEAKEVPVRSHRPSRSLREEPAAQCLLTLAQLAHSDWGIIPAQFDLVFALMEAISGLDLVRAQLLAYNAFRMDGWIPRLEPFDALKPVIQERITFALGERYERLRGWIAAFAEGEPMPLDHFWSRLFGEVLSQVGYGFHDDFDAAGAAANLIDSARKFRQMIAETGTTMASKSPAQEYVEMVAEGIIADQYLRGWEMDEAEAVLLAPAYTFLLRNTPVDYQFWLNVGGGGWAQRLYQPLTNPYVLSKHWIEGRKWTDSDEVIVNQEALYRLTAGLIRRCRKAIYLGFSELGEQGYEQRGELLQAIQRMLRRL